MEVIPQQVTFLTAFEEVAEDIGPVALPLAIGLMLFSFWVVMEYFDDTRGMFSWGAEP